MEKTIFTCPVKQAWVDYNGHLNDAEYARIFSLSVDALMESIGLNRAGIEANKYSIFTLETHVCYLDEVNVDENIKVCLQLLDYDAKRLHAMFVMYDEAGNRVATSEQMLMGMDMQTRRPAPFPSDVADEVEKIWRNQNQMEKPKEAGRTIGIRKK